MRKYTVSQLTRELHALMAGRYPVLEVQGEVGQLATPASGHAYLMLRENDAVLHCVVWRSTWQNLRYRPKRGDRVVCRGKMGVFAGKGSYQLYISGIAPAGEGALAAEIARRRARLEADGLLDPRRKRPLPTFPKVVGVATSLTGAALQDFLKVSRERFPAARILVAHCTVQGPTTPPSVIQALEVLLEDGRPEVLVVTRGGGSKEDLLGFQDEHLARYVAQCPVPVVSAVGHQIDTTLIDLVADAVAPTPSAAAMTALPDGPAWTQRVDEAAMGLERAMTRQMQRRREALQHLRARLRHPGQRLAEVRRQRAEWVRQLHLRMQWQLRQRSDRVDQLVARLASAMKGRVPGGHEALAQWEARLLRAVQAQVQQRRQRVRALQGTAEALSPQQVLGRGYALVTGPQGVVRSVADVTAGEHIKVHVGDGAFDANVLAQAGAPHTQEPSDA